MFRTGSVYVNATFDNPDPDPDPNFRCTDPSPDSTLHVKVLVNYLNLKLFKIHCIRGTKQAKDEHG